MPSPTLSTELLAIADAASDSHPVRRVWLEQVAGKVARLEAGVEAALLFHSEERWTGAESRRWRKLTGADEATTKTLCDFLRQVMEDRA